MGSNPMVNVNNIMPFISLYQLKCYQKHCISNSYSLLEVLPECENTDASIGTDKLSQQVYGR